MDCVHHYFHMVICFLFAIVIQESNAQLNVPHWLVLDRVIAGTVNCDSSPRCQLTLLVFTSLVVVLRRLCLFVQSSVHTECHGNDAM